MCFGNSKYFHKKRIRSSVKFSFGENLFLMKAKLENFQPANTNFRCLSGSRSMRSVLKASGIINHGGKWKHVPRSHANYGCEASDTWVCKFKYINKNLLSIDGRHSFRGKIFCNSRVKLNMHAVVSRCLIKFQAALFQDLFMMYDFQQKFLMNLCSA